MLPATRQKLLRLLARKGGVTLDLGRKRLGDVTARSFYRHLATLRADGTLIYQWQDRQGQRRYGTVLPRLKT